VGNEENRYPVPDINKTVINAIKESSDTYKKNSQRRNLGKKSLRNSWRRY
jgi:hypothetical protein